MFPGGFGILIYRYRLFSGTQGLLLDMVFWKTTPSVKQVFCCSHLQ